MGRGRGPHGASLMRHWSCSERSGEKLAEYDGLEARDKCSRVDSHAANTAHPIFVRVGLGRYGK
jgi:hypothetical protein